MLKTADMHCDTISRLMDGLQEDTLFRNRFHIDVEKMRAGGCVLQNFAMYVDLKKHADSYGYCNMMIDKFLGELGKCTEYISQVKSWDDIEKTLRKGCICALLTVEEGGVCGGDVNKLRALYDRGVRMLTLTWNYANELGYPHCGGVDAVNGDGLTKRGVEFIAEMEQLGMIVDVSHLSDDGFYDVLRVSKKPFVASHSNSRAVCNCTRNLTDDMIRRLAERGGLTGLNFCTDFLEEKTPGANPQDIRGGIQCMVRHVMHIIDVGGCECLGIGSDFDGIPANDAIPDCSHIWLLADALEKAGVPYSTIEAVFSKNVLRLYRELL